MSPADSGFRKVPTIQACRENRLERLTGAQGEPLSPPSRARAAQGEPLSPCEPLSPSGSPEPVALSGERLRAAQGSLAAAQARGPVALTEPEPTAAASPVTQGPRVLGARPGRQGNEICTVGQPIRHIFKGTTMSTDSPAQLLAGLVLTGRRQVSPLHNEKLAGILRTDDDHYSVFFNRCQGAQSGFGIRTLVLVRTWIGYGADASAAWRVETESFLASPSPIVSRKGTLCEPVPAYGEPRRAVHKGDKR